MELSVCLAGNNSASDRVNGSLALLFLARGFVIQKNHRGQFIYWPNL
jgi:hypothetical protein